MLAIDFEYYLLAKNFHRTHPQNPAAAMTMMAVSRKSFILYTPNNGLVEPVQWLSCLRELLPSIQAASHALRRGVSHPSPL